jgi:hypothetical protein
MWKISCITEIYQWFIREELENSEISWYLKGTSNDIITSELVFLLTVAMKTIEMDFPVTKIINTEVEVSEVYSKVLDR